MKRIIALLLVVFTLLSFTACKKDKNKETEPTPPRYTYVKMTVAEYGDIILKLDSKEAPKTVANFVKLVNEGFYNGLTFHRVIEGFMIQGGDPKADGTGGSSQKIVGEFSANGYRNTIKHKRGVISMARSNAYNSASSQFFIMHDTATHLDGNYAAFGWVISGMEVVDAIVDATAYYGDDNGKISNKSMQAVISEMKVITEEEALKVN
jgi:peptidyl-prolyl cis-trans isomerase B (cyclophilin B)